MNAFGVAFPSPFFPDMNKSFEVQQAPCNLNGPTVKTKCQEYRESQS